MSVEPKKQAGFAAVEILIIVVMVILIALAGWWVYSQTQDETEPAESTTSAEIEDVDSDNTPAIDQAEDLENAEQYLDNLDIDDDLDTSELDSTLTY